MSNQKFQKDFSYRKTNRAYINRYTPYNLDRPNLPTSNTLDTQRLYHIPNIPLHQNNQFPERSRNNCTNHNNYNNYSDYNDYNENPYYYRDFHNYENHPVNHPVPIRVPVRGSVNNRINHNHNNNNNYYHNSQYEQTNNVPVPSSINHNNIRNQQRYYYENQDYNENRDLQHPNPQLDNKINLESIPIPNMNINTNPNSNPNSNPNPNPRNYSKYIKNVNGKFKYDRSSFIKDKEQQSLLAIQVAKLQAEVDFLKKQKEEEKENEKAMATDDLRKIIFKLNPVSSNVK